MPELHAPVVSATTAGALLVIQMALALLVVLARRQNKQSLGDGGNPVVLRAIRRHGNFAENAAIFVVALALYELIGGEQSQAEIYAGLFVLGRLSHAVGLSLKATVNPFRVAGIGLTVAVGLMLGARLVMIGLPLLMPGA